MTRTNRASEEQAATTGEFPRGQPEAPGVYQDPYEPRLLWFSWFRPSWPPPRQPDGSFRGPLDKLQLTIPDSGQRMNGPVAIAHLGIKLLGAYELQNDGYRISLVTAYFASIEDPLLDEHRSKAQFLLLDELVTHGRRLRDALIALPQRVTIGDGTRAAIEAHEELVQHSRDFFGGPWVYPEEADREYIALLAKLGRKGKDLAAKLQKAPPVSEEEADTWAPWLPPVEGGRFPARHTRLVEALWLDIVRPQLERAARKPAALPSLVHDPVTQIFSSPKMREEGGQMALDLGLPQPCIIREVADLASAERGIKLFQSIQAHRVLRHIAFTAHERAISTPGWSPHLEYEGGYAALAEACGISGRKGAEQVRALVDLFSVLDLTLPNYQGGLLTRTFIEAKGRRRALLRIIPGTPILPGYVHDLQRAAGVTSAAARLIPLLPVPPILGRANDAGAQATLQLRVMAHLRDHAPDLAQGRGAPIPLDTWVKFAAESHVPRSLAPKLLLHWQEDHRDGPAVLKQVDRDRYTLSDAHTSARTFLEDGGRRSLDSSEAGRRSVAKREAARRRVGLK